MARRIAAPPGHRTEAVAAAVRAAKNGRLVALPAETGYVLASDAFAASGVAALQRAKHLSPATSMGILVGHAAGVHGIAAAVSPAVLDLMAAFWPGQLSIVLPMQRSLQWTVPTDRVVVRMPLHPLLLDVVAGVGPMVYSGATAEECEAAELLLDAGPRPGGAASTLLDAMVNPPVMLREGAVTVDALLAVVPELLIG